MKIYTLLKKGTNHPENCEDFIFSTMINETIFAGAVFDGCSSGKESHFASALFGKSMQKVCNNLKNFETNNITELSESIFYQTVMTVKSIQQTLELSMIEILSSFILLVQNIETKETNIIVAGDGFFSLNGERTEIDQDNKPQYPAYFLDKISNFEDFQKWNKSKNTNVFKENISDVTISTDGIFSFIVQNSGTEIDNDINPEYLLTKDVFLSNNSMMLGRKYNIIKNKAGMINFDDIAMIRIIN